MGRALYEHHPIARDTFAQADDTLGILLSTLCFEGPAEALNDTVNTQPAILATSIATLRVLRDEDLEPPAYVAGHSMGEFSALVAADALSYEEGLKLVRERGRLMKEAGRENPGGMVAVLGLERDAVEAACGEAREGSPDYVGVANDNCPGQVVISGALPALERAVEMVQQRGAKRVVRLNVSIAAHSPLMADAAETFRRRLDEVSFQPTSCPLVMNATAHPVTAPDMIRQALARQLTSPVQWTQSMQWLLTNRVSRFVEVGPKSVLTNLLRRIDRTVERLTTTDALAGREAAE
jgi:[acyl-carrier-protein] S-malonyltransferase